MNDIEKGLFEAGASADAGGMAFAVFCDKLGISEPTGYRWRSEGRFTLPGGKQDGVCNVGGRPFIETDAIKEFWRRARAGEFAHAPRGAAAASVKASRKRSGKRADGSEPSALEQAA